MSRSATPGDLARIARLSLRRPLVGRRRSWVVLVVGLAAIVGWQVSFARHPDLLDTRYRLSASRGLNNDQRFVYFFYYLGLYPVLSDEGHVPFLADPSYRRFSREAAERVVRERGDTLLMEWRHTIRVGEPGKMFLFLPDALMKGGPRPPLSVRPLHGTMFVLALCAVYAAFWWARLSTLGAVLVLLAGSNPFQLFEVYADENVFGWPITTALLVLALSVAFLRRRPPRAGWAFVPLAAIGALLGTVAQVRTEPVVILASAVLVVLLARGASVPRRLAFAATLVACFVGVSSAWRAWFDAKFDEASRVVAAAGGSVYNGPRDAGHAFWHPIWCGLGDFDTKHGYVWLDTAAVKYANPILREVYHLPVPEWGEDNWWAYPGQYWDEAHRYYKMPYEMPHYSEVLRRKVLGDIVSDPGWYAGILGRRAWRLLRETTPVRVRVGAHGLTLPGAGFLALPILAGLAAARAWTLLKLCAFPLATSLPAFLVFSGNGMAFYSWYPLVAVAVALAVALDVGAAWLARRRRRR